MTARSARRRIGTSLAAVLARARREARRFPAVPLVLVGAGCGLVAVLFHHALTLGRFLLVETALSVASPWLSAALVLLLPASVGGLLAFAMRRFSPHAGGGLALVRRAYAQGHGILDRKTFFGAFVANPLSLGAGTPLGPEGPTVVLTSTFSVGLARFLGLPSRVVRGMIPIGTAAGIAAIFNTPITGVVFALEEVVGSASRGVLGGSLVAAVAAAVVHRQVLGGERLLPASAAAWHDPRELLGFALVGLVAGGVAGFVPRLVPLLRQRLETLTTGVGRLGYVARGCLAGLAVGALGLISPETLGTGYRPIGVWLTGGGTAEQSLLAFFAKSAGLVVALSGSLVGGVFAPSLFIGAALGAATGHATHLLFPSAPIDPAAYALVGMGAFFAGFLRTPLAAVLIVFELTGDYGLVLPLMLAVAISLVVARRVSRKTLVEQQLDEEGVRETASASDVSSPSGTGGHEGPGA
ncbi:MAG: chloride channel protein [Acidobacteria bacterium]|nr:chloride channel protein [Acidobacteriota bacterium]